MAVMNIDIDCDLMKVPKVQTPCKVLSSEDENKISVSVCKGGAPENIGGTVTAYIIKPDGITETETGSISGNVASVELPSTAVDVPGIILVSVKVTDSGAITTLAAVAVCVQ